MWVGAFAMVAAMVASADIAPPPSPVAIVGGTEVPECGWPNVVALGNVCTGTLVHPRVVVYAAHCGGGGAVTFGDDVVSGATREVQTVRCGQFPREEGELGRDFAYCVLAQPQLDVPIAAPLMGCEVDALAPDTEVVVVGFGLDENDVGGIKRQLVTTLDRIENEEAFIGGDGQDACLGDSGGPAFVRIPDPGGGPDTWRHFGIVSHGDTQCLDGSWYGLMHVGMPWFEAEADYDLTPCTDADGTWNPDARCNALAADLTDADGTWADACADVPRGTAVSTCGPPYTPGNDSTPPVATLVDPGQDVALASDPTTGLAEMIVTVAVDDPGGIGIDEVRLTVDGTEIPGGFDGLPPYEFDAGFPAGAYEVGALAFDRAGGVAMAEAVLVVVDGELPGEGSGTAAETDGGQGTDGTTTSDGNGSGEGDDGCGCRQRRRPRAPAGMGLLIILVIAARRRH